MTKVTMDQKQQEQSSSPKFNTTLLRFGDMSPHPHLVLPANNPSSHPGPSAAHTEPGLQFGDTSPLVLSPGPSTPPKLPLVLPSSPVLSPADGSPDPKSSVSDRPALFFPDGQKRTDALERMIHDALGLRDPKKTGETPALTRKERRKLKQRANRAKGRRDNAESQRAEREIAERANAERENAERENAERENAEGEDRTRTPSENLAPAVAPALTRKERRRQRQRANRAAARQRAEREADAYSSENPPPTQPPYTPPTTGWTAAGAPPAVGPYERAIVLFNETRVSARSRISPGELPTVSQHPPPGVPSFLPGVPSFLPEVRPLHVDVFPPPDQGVGRYPMEYFVPRTRYVAIKHLRPPGAPYTVPAVFGPDPSGHTAWYDGATGRFFAAFPWISVGGGEAVNPGFGNHGHYWPDHDAWNQVYNQGLRRSDTALWPSQFANSDSSHGLRLVVEENDEAFST